MSYQKAKEYLDCKGYGDRVHLFDVSTATVPEAAAAVGCLEGMIAKTLSFSLHGEPILIVAAGDTKIDNSKYKGNFREKAHMLSPHDASALIGHDVGGVCPFGVNNGVKVYLDVSLKRYETVYPACGNAQSAVRLTPNELFCVIDGAEWVDVCKIKE